MTVPVLYPLPNLKQIVESLAGNTFFGKMDLRRGYFQILVEESSIPLTAFVTPFGLYECVRMPFGVRNGPSHFQKCMNDAFSDLLGIFCFIYLDDIIIFGKDEDSFVTAMSKVLARLEALRLRANLEKCEFGVQSLQYLGFIISKDGLAMSEERKSAVVAMKEPSTKKQLRSFLGTCNYFRDFIPHYSVVVKPLFALTADKVPFVWTEDCRKVFGVVKDLIVEAPRLNFIDYSMPIFLRTDASDVGLGGVLYQLDPDGKEMIVQYISRSFNPVERNWSTIEHEVFGVYFCMLACSHHLLGHHFIVETDHKNILYLQKSQAPKIVRWMLRVQEFDFEVKFIPGSDNILADTLSRLHLLTGTSSPADGLDSELYDLVVVTLDADPNEVIARFHNTVCGHFGIQRTAKLMKEHGIEWPSMLEDISTFISNCATCQKCRAGKASYAAAVKSTMVSEPFEVVVIDSVGPLPADAYGNKFLILVMDAFTRFVELFPAPDTTAIEAARAVLHVFGRYGAPKALRSDRGTQYANEIIRCFLKLCGTKHMKSTPYRHEGNGLAERCIREFNRHVRALCFDLRVEQSWSMYVPIVQRIVNSCYHSSIGTAPIRLLYGGMVTANRGLLFPFYDNDSTSTYADYVQELGAAERELMEKSRQHQQKVIDEFLKDAPANPDTFSVGDLVLVSYPQRPPSKLAALWRGPYSVTVAGDRTFTVQDPVTMRSYDVDITRLRLWKSGDNTLPVDEVLLRDKSTFIVEKIIRHSGHVKKQKNMKFLVKWEGYDDPTDLTWEPISNLRNNVIFERYCQENSLNIRGV